MDATTQDRVAGVLLATAAVGAAGADLRSRAATDARVGMSNLPAGRAEVWSQRVGVAESSTPASFEGNGWVVEAFQAAWCAIATTLVSGHRTRGEHLAHAVQAAVRGGRDADTVAASAGGLLGAAYGASAVPARWRGALHGWPGLRADDLATLAGTALRRGGR